MADVLSRIVKRKREDVARRLGGVPVSAAYPTNRSLREALSRRGVRFIMEVKRASPSGHSSPHSVEVAAKAYAPIADAISVLTDGPDFGGSFNDLRVVRQLFDGPILAKDFIVDPAQVSEARAVGADAILIMMSVLDDLSVAEVRTEAARFRMDVIFEAHDEQELGRALAHGAGIIGINNRNLKTLGVDLSTTERLAGLVPSDVLVISESGIAKRADVVRLAGQVDAFLVGSSLMAAPDIASAARALVHGNVKICGLTNSQDVELAGKAGASHAGFNFVKGSPRCLEPSQARPMIDTARSNGMKLVGVFRDQPFSDVAGIAAMFGLDAIQLHGREGADYIQSLRGSGIDRAEIWDVCQVGDTMTARRPGCDRVLFDTCAKGVCGGTGKAFDWSLIGDREDLTGAFLAGGIGPENVRPAEAVGAYGLDVGSGVESVPGRKDPARMKALFEQLRPPARGDRP